MTTIFGLIITKKKEKKTNRNREIWSIGWAPEQHGTQNAVDK